MTSTRRTFLQAGGGLISEDGQSHELKIARTTETRSTCPYCSVRCGVIIHTLGDRTKNVAPGTAMVRGGFNSIIRGEVSPEWAKTHHRLWHERVSSR